MRGVPGSTPGHGTVARYNAGCHCDRCRAALTRWATLRRMAGDQRHVDSTGTARRLRALTALGWPEPVMAARLGVTRARVQKLRKGEYPTIHVDTRDSIARLYDQLSGKPGPSAISRRRALAAGWAPPLAWDSIDYDEHPHGTIAADDTLIDDAAVERTLAGDRVPLTRLERVEVIRRLAARGMSDADMGVVVGITGRSVGRIRTEFSIDTGWGAA